MSVPANACITDLATFETAPDDIAQGAPDDGPQIIAARAAHAEIQFQIRTLAYVGAGLSVGRYFVHVIDSVPCIPLGYLWPLWDAKKQTFADKVLGTLVIKG